MSIGVGVGKGAGAGVLIKSAEALERMEKVNTLVVDKTGTLTEGKPKVTAIVSAEGLSEAEILPLAASLERSSEHPLAAAIVSCRAGSQCFNPGANGLRLCHWQGRYRQNRRQVGGAGQCKADGGPRHQAG